MRIEWKSFWNFLKPKRVINKKLKMSNAGEELYKKINTFVFFDLETTDLIKGSRMPRITELSMVATDRYSIKSDSRNKLALPRIIHKLTIPVCPQKPIHPQASFVSNLWNDTLEAVSPFDEKTYDLIMQFIDRLPGLICFVAHNGNQFDYPIFLLEIELLGKTLPDRILCVDTLTAFQEFYSDLQDEPQKPIQMLPEGHDEVDEEELARLNQSKLNFSLDDHWNDTLYSVLDDVEKVEAERRAMSKLTCDNGKDVLDAITNKNAESVGNCSDPNAPKNSPKTMQAINENTPKNQMINNSKLDNSIRCKVLSGARKQLNFGQNKPKNFKLSTLYMHMIGCEPDNLHCAEADCISMLRCVCQMGKHFAEWADLNAVSLNLFKK